MNASESRKNRRRRFLDIVDSWFVKSGYVGHFGTIAISDVIGKEPGKVVFLEATCEALKLIRDSDPRRFRRICRQIHVVVNRPLISAGTYQHSLRACNVDFTKRFTTPYPDWNLRMYSCLLVHEATHGVLHEKGILYNRENWQRVEALCRREEFRFARRVDAAWAEEYVKTFDPMDWDSHWGSSQTRRAAAWKRIREIFRSQRAP